MREKGGGGGGGGGVGSGTSLRLHTIKRKTNWHGTKDVWKTPTK